MNRNEPMEMNHENDVEMNKLFNEDNIMEMNKPIEFIAISKKHKSMVL